MLDGLWLFSTAWGGRGGLVSAKDIASARSVGTAVLRCEPTLPGSLPSKDRCSLTVLTGNQAAPAAPSRAERVHFVQLNVVLDIDNAWLGCYYQYNEELYNIQAIY